MLLMMIETLAYSFQLKRSPKNVLLMMTVVLQIHFSLKKVTGCVKASLDVFMFRPSQY